MASMRTVCLKQAVKLLDNAIECIQKTKYPDADQIEDLYEIHQRINHWLCVVDVPQNNVPLKKTNQTLNQEEGK